MHKIDIHNYEAYLLDFSEGNLSDECQMELELFLIQHPELNIDLTELSLVTLETEPIHFKGKTNLKKSESNLVSENQFIGYIENQLSTKDRLEVEKSCAVNPSLAKELALYNNTIIKADVSVVYQKKASLKRKPKVIWFNFSATQFAAAASVLFLIGLFVFWPKPNITVNNSSLAIKTKHEKFNVTPSVNDTESNSQKQDEILSVTKEPNKKLAQNLSTKITQQSIANTITTKQNNEIVLKDTITNIVVNNSSVNIHKNETLVMQNSSSIVKQNIETVIQLITENDEEEIILNTDKKKKGIWTTVSRTLKNLNHVGVKSVDGDEENNKENTSYALTLGGLSITHKAGNL